MTTEFGLGPDAAPGDAAGDGIACRPRTPQQIASERRLQQTQAKIDEVVGIMSENVDKVLVRDTHLSELDNRADALQVGASQFEQQASRLKKKLWLQNLKVMIIIGVIGFIIFSIIVGARMPKSEPARLSLDYSDPLMPPRRLEIPKETSRELREDETAPTTLVSNLEDFYGM